MVSTAVNDEIERLIAAALQEGTSRPLNDVELFAQELEIIPSEFNKIPNYLIFDAYQNWTTTPITREAFFIEFAKLFQKTNLGRPYQHRGYKIMCSKIQPSEEALWKDYARKRKANKKKPV